MKSYGEDFPVPENATRTAPEENQSYETSKNVTRKVIDNVIAGQCAE